MQVYTFLAIDRKHLNITFNKKTLAIKILMSGQCFKTFFFVTYEWAK